MQKQPAKPHYRKESPMENALTLADPQNTTALRPRSSALQKAAALPLNDDREGMQKLAGRLYRDFHAMKTYGKEPESLESIISLFNETLADYPAEWILLAMHEHAKVSAEFPTPAEIIAKINQADDAAVHI